ncbi:MAG: sugar transferase [Candidatus Eremiobacteraeota bacterium]|nr:sugar transferase [Candidatus Eremiobacteraeota bacterium]
MSCFSAFMKRVFDILLATGLLIILSPLIIGCIIAVKLSSAGPVFYLQRRVGKDGKDFIMWKFRTMVKGAEKIGAGIHVNKDDPRITRIGKFLRRYSLDELPQLFNVIGGSMSIVGPRPTLRYQVERYDEEQKKRLLVKPGMTGLAQVMGRNALTWEEKIKWDIKYVENYSFTGDLMIIAKTFGVLLSDEGIYGDPGQLAKIDDVENRGAGNDEENRKEEEK